MITRFKTLATALLVSSGLVLGSAAAFAQATPANPATPPFAGVGAGNMAKEEAQAAQHRAVEKKKAERKAEEKKSQLKADEKKADAKKAQKATETKKGVN